MYLQVVYKWAETPASLGDIELSQYHFIRWASSITAPFIKQNIFCGHCFCFCNSIKLFLTIMMLLLLITMMSMMTMLTIFDEDDDDGENIDD